MGQVGGMRAVVGPALGVFKRHKAAVRVVVLALIAAFLGAGVWRSWSSLAGYTWHIEWPLLLAAFALLVAQELSFALIWRQILRRLDAELGVVDAQRIYLNAEFVRYIPGNVWHVVARVLAAERAGVPKATGFASMVIELATKIAAAALVFAATLLAWPDAGAFTATVPRGVLVTVAGVGIPLLLVGLYPPLLERALNAGMRLLKREPLRLGMRYRDVLAVTGWWAISWALAGIGFWLLLRAVVIGQPSLAALVVATGIYAAAWDIGFLSVVTPSGIGFREGVIALLLTASGLVPAGAGIATVIAVLMRLLTTGAEVLCVGAAHLAARRTAQGTAPTPEGTPAPEAESTRS